MGPSAVVPRAGFKRLPALADNDRESADPLYPLQLGFCIHHVNELVDRSKWIYWVLGFIIWGAIMLVAGWYILARGREETVAE
jgi:hypothetical protein